VKTLGKIRCIPRPYRKSFLVIKLIEDFFMNKKLQLEEGTHQAQLAKEWRASFEKDSDAELQVIRAREKKCNGWVSVRGVYLILLREECEKRGLDYNNNI